MKLKKLVKTLKINKHLTFFQVAMATGCVLFQRFYYAKSLVRIPFDVVAMSCICLASKIEEAPRRIRDIINVFTHINQIRAEKPILPVALDPAYIAKKNDVINNERKVLKELGFCVHVKHPHKVSLYNFRFEPKGSNVTLNVFSSKFIYQIIVMYLQWLELAKHRELLQMSW